METSLTASKQKKLLNRSRLHSTYSKQSDGILLAARPSHKSESESDVVKSGLRSDVEREEQTRAFSF